jgi:hypothetical protein
MVLQNTRVEDKELGVHTNLLKLCFIEDPQATFKLEALAGRELDKYRFANDSTIIMIAKCLKYRLQPKHDDMGEAYRLWESLRPVRSIIVAAAAASEIEELEFSQFDSNTAYFDEMVSLYSNIKIEQGNDAINPRRFLFLIIQALQEVTDNETLCTIYLYPKFQNKTLTLDLMKDDIIICEMQKARHKRTHASHQVNQVKHQQQQNKLRGTNKQPHVRNRHFTAIQKQLYAGGI